MKRDSIPTVTIRAKRIPVQKVVLKNSGLVPKSKIDSINKANPRMGAAIGKPYKGSGGMDTYGDDASDKIKLALRKKGR